VPLCCPLLAVERNYLGGRGWVKRKRGSGRCKDIGRGMQGRRQGRKEGRMEVGWSIQNLNVFMQTMNDGVYVNSRSTTTHHRDNKIKRPDECEQETVLMTTTTRLKRRNACGSNLKEIKCGCR